MPKCKLKAAFLYFLQGFFAEKSDGSERLQRKLETEENIHYSDTWKSFRQQDLHRSVILNPFNIKTVN